LAAGVLAATVAIGGGIAWADGGMRGHGQHGMMGGQMGMMGQGGMMDGMMGGQMGGRMGGMMGGMGPKIDFTAADADKDGKVTEAELTAWRAAQTAALDADKDGKLSADEIATFKIAEVSTRIAEHAALMVTHLDSDGDGLLSAAELLARPMPMLAFAHLDSNGDGALTQDELAQPRMGKGMPMGAPTDGATTTPGN